jgi:hypothetical protein
MKFEAFTGLQCRVVSNVVTSVLDEFSVSILHPEDGTSSFLPNGRNNLRNRTVLRTIRPKLQNGKQFTAQY